MNTKSIIYFSAVGFGVLFLWFFIWPKVQGIESIQNDIKAQEAEKIVLEETTDNIEDAYNFYINLSEEDQELMNTALPEVPDRINLANTLYRMISENGLVSNNVSVTEAGPSQVLDTNAATIHKVSISINADGSYDSLKELIKTMEENLRITNITTIGIEASADTGEDSSINTQSFSINAEVYYLPEE